jgi:hypothetical protein
MAEVITGEDKAWEIIADLVPEDACRRTGAVFDDSSRTYRLEVFGTWFSLDAEKKEIVNLSPEGEIFLKRFRYFFVLSALWYMVKVTDAGPAGRLVKPSGMPGGDIFFRGTHVLPLEGVAKKYARDREGFRERGRAYGGREVAYGDIAVEFLPFPKIPVTVILWLADEEWEARADLLFDASSLQHLPIDILWSIAMMSVLLFL